MWNRRSDLEGAGQPADLRRLAAAPASRPGRRRHRHHAGHQVLHAEGARHGARRLSHPQHAGAAGHRRPRPGALPDRGQRLQRRGSAAVLRQRAVRHRPRPQRQPHQCPGPEAGALRRRSPPHQHRQRHRGADQRPRARARKRGARVAADARRGLRRGRSRAPPHQGLVCGGGADRRPGAACLSRPVRHPAALVRRGRRAGRTPKSWWRANRSPSSAPAIP